MVNKEKVKTKKKKEKLYFKKKDQKISNLLLNISFLENYFSCTFKAQIIKNKDVASKGTPNISITRQVKET